MNVFPSDSWSWLGDFKCSSVTWWDYYWAVMVEPYSVRTHTHWKTDRQLRWCCFFFLSEAHNQAVSPPNSKQIKKEKSKGAVSQLFLSTLTTHTVCFPRQLPLRVILPLEKSVIKTAMRFALFHYIHCCISCAPFQYLLMTHCGRGRWLVCQRQAAWLYDLGSKKSVATLISYHSLQ